MDLHRIKIFCKVIELKSFSRAAEVIGLAQPTVSEHMRLLEDELGEKLLERSSRTIEPTPAGKLLLPYARELLRINEEARQALANFRGQPGGKLQIGASTIPGAYLLPRQLQSFKRLHPKAELALKISSTGQTIRDLLEGQIELALIGADNQQQLLQLTPLATDEMILVVSPAHPWAEKPSIKITNLKDSPFILREEGSGSRTATTDALRSKGYPLEQLNLVAEMGNSESVRQSVKAGIGAAILSQRAVIEELESGKLTKVAVEDLKITRTIYLARHKRRTLSPLAQTFMEHLLSQDLD